MRTTTLANAAILAGVAAAQMLLPLISRAPPASALSHQEPGEDLSFRPAAGLLRYETTVSFGWPPQKVSLYVSQETHLSWVPDVEACEDTDCPGGSCESDLFR